jgi:hypothetical protein
MNEGIIPKWRGGEINECGGGYGDPGIISMRANPLFSQRATNLRRFFEGKEEEGRGDVCPSHIYFPIFPTWKGWEEREGSSPSAELIPRFNPPFLDASINPRLVEWWAN